MNRNAKIRRVIQVIAIMLVLTLSFPQIPLAQKLGLGYEEVHAEPGEGIEIGEPQTGTKELFILLEAYLCGYKLIMTPEYDEDADPEPEGTITYYYKIIDPSVGDDGSEFEILAENVSLTKTIEFDISSYVGKQIIISYVYTGDATYKEFSSETDNEDYIIDLFPCEITSEPVISVNGDVYTLAFETKKGSDQATYPVYYYILTPYDSAHFLPEILVELVEDMDEDEDCAEDFGTKFGYGVIEWAANEEEKRITLEIDGSDFNEGFYVYQVVTTNICGDAQNVSETAISPAFHTPLTFTKNDLTASCTAVLVYDNAALTPQVTVAVKTDIADDKRKSFAAEWLSEAINNKKLQYEFKQIKDYKNDPVTNAEKADTINAAGVYEIYVSGSYDGCSISETDSLGEVSVKRAPIKPSQVDVYTVVNAENETILLSGKVTGIDGYGTPTGTLAFEYSIDGESWEAVSENEYYDLGAANAYTWSIPDALKDKIFLLKATYSGDENYKSAESESYTVDIEAPAFIISDVTKEDSVYSFSLEVTNEGTVDLNCYAILTEYNESGYDATAEDIADDNNIVNLTYTDQDSNSVYYTAEIDGTEFDPGIYVFQVVAVDTHGNISEKLVTAPFITTLELMEDDLSAEAEDLVYSGADQNPTVTLSVNNDSETVKALITEKIEEAVNNKKITYSFIRVEDADGETISNGSEVAAVKEAGVYDIYAVITGSDIEIDKVSLGQIKVDKATVSAPAEELDLIVTVSGDFTKYIVAADVSGISLAEGQSLEFKFNDGEFGTENQYIADVEETIIVSVRIAATANTEAGVPVSAEITTNERSEAPAITESTNFSTEKMTVEISANNEGDTIYYTVGDQAEKSFVCTANSKTASEEISESTKVSAYVVEPDKVKSGIVEAEYTYVEPQTSQEVQEAPNNTPDFKVTVSEDKSKYIVTANTFNVTNATGKKIEYSCDGTNYSENNKYEVEAGKEISVYIRFAATDELIASDSVSATYEAPKASSAPTLTKSTNFSTEKMTVEISANNAGDTIYYTVGDQAEKTFVCTEDSKTASVEISNTTMVSAYVVEKYRTKSKAVTETYTKKDPNVYDNSDIKATVSPALTYTGKALEFEVSLSAISKNEERKAEIEKWLSSEGTGATISYKFKQITDGNNKEVTADFTTEVINAGTYEIYASTTDESVTISDVCLNTFTVDKMTQEVPDAAPKIIQTLSDDGLTIVLKANVSDVKNVEGRTIEYKFSNDNDFSSNDSYTTKTTDAGSEISVSIRYASTENLKSSDIKTSEIVKVKDLNVGPELTKSQTFEDQLTVTIKNAQGFDAVYYTTNGSDPDEKSEHTNDSKTLPLEDDTTIKAVYAFNGKLLTKVSTETYTKKKAVTVSLAPSTNEHTAHNWKLDGFTYTSSEKNVIATVKAIFSCDGCDEKKEANGKITLLLSDQGGYSIYMISAVGPDEKEYNKYFVYDHNAESGQLTDSFADKKYGLVNDGKYHTITSKSGVKITNLNGDVISRAYEGEVVNISWVPRAGFGFAKWDLSGVMTYEVVKPDTMFIMGKNNVIIDYEESFLKANEVYETLPDEFDKSIKVKSLQFNNTKLTLPINSASYSNPVKVKTENEDLPPIIYVTDNKDIVVVDKAGNFYPTGIGETTVTAYCGNRKAKVKVNVVNYTTEAYILNTDGKDVTGSEIELKSGEVTFLTVLINPIDSTDSRTVKWKSSNKKIIVKNGIITAKEGNYQTTATITATIKCTNPEIGKTFDLIKTVTVRVDPVDVPENATENREYKLKLNKTKIQIDASDVKIQKITANLNGKSEQLSTVYISAESTNEDVVTVNNVGELSINGKKGNCDISLEANSPGTAYIIVTSTNGDEKVNVQRCKVTVNETVKSISVESGTLQVEVAKDNKKTITMRLGEKGTVDIVLNPNYPTNLGKLKITGSGGVTYKDGLICAKKITKKGKPAKLIVKCGKMTEMVYITIVK